MHTLIDASALWPISRYDCARVSPSDPSHRGDTVALHQDVIVGIDGSAPSEEVLTRLSVRLTHLDAAHPEGASEVIIGDPAEALSALACDASLLVFFRLDPRLESRTSVRR